MTTSMPRRPGKTQRDALNGAKSRNAANKAARAEWNNLPWNTKVKFPLDTCNGKRSRALKAAGRK